MFIDSRKVLSCRLVCVCACMLDKHSARGGGAYMLLPWWYERGLIVPFWVSSLWLTVSTDCSRYSPWLRGHHPSIKLRCTRLTEYSSLVWLSLRSRCAPLKIVAHFGYMFRNKLWTVFWIIILVSFFSNRTLGISPKPREVGVGAPDPGIRTFWPVRDVHMKDRFEGDTVSFVWRI